MSTAKLSADGEIQIPREIREQLNLEPGMTLSLHVQGRGIIVSRMDAQPDDSWMKMRGMVQTGPSLTAALEEEHRAELGSELD